MDAINLIFENYGCDRLTRVFKSYWLLLLLIKQVMFSLFMVSPMLENIPENDTRDLSEEFAAAQPGENSWSSLKLAGVFLTLAQLDPKTSVEPDENK